MHRRRAHEDLIVAVVHGQRQNRQSGIRSRSARMPSMPDIPGRPMSVKMTSVSRRPDVRERFFHRPDEPTQRKPGVPLISIDEALSNVANVLDDDDAERGLVGGHGSVK